MSDPSRHRVSYNQLVTLCDFLTNHKDIATGYNKTARAREFHQRIWQTITESLNSHGDGAVKDWKGWSRYWNDYKSKLKKTVSAINASLRRTGGGPSDVRNLTDIESRFLEIMGGNTFGSGLPGIGIEPFSQEFEVRETEGMVWDNTSIIGSTQTSPQPGPSRPAITPPITEHSQLPDTEQSSTPHRPQLPVTNHPSISAPYPPAAGTTSQLSTPSRLRRSPRRRNLNQSELPPQRNQIQRRRQRRRDPPMSQEEARRNLIGVSNWRAQTDADRNQILRHMLEELKELKAILRARLPLPDLADTPILDTSPASP